MRNNKMFLLGIILCGTVAFNAAIAQENQAEEMEQVSADAIAGYDVQGSLFQQITDLEQEKEALLAEKAEPVKSVGASTKVAATTMSDVAKSYKLVNVVGAGNQLQATIADLNSGQTKRISVGKKLDNWTVKSISLDDGVVFVGPDGEVQNLNVSNGN